MSSENASMFVTKMLMHDEAVLALLPADVSPDSLSAEEMTALTKSANEAGRDFTADELKKAYLDSKTLGEDELSAVAGGMPIGHRVRHATLDALTPNQVGSFGAPDCLEIPM